jgi:hypothetical protein
MNIKVNLTHVLCFAVLAVPVYSTRTTTQDLPKPVPLHPSLHYYEPVKGKIERQEVTADVCVYGGSAAGVAAAVEARRRGRSVVIVEPGRHLGGLTAGGLSYTDIGNGKAIGGLAREFYRRCGRHYGVAEEFLFEPHVAEQVFKEMVEEAKVPVYFGHFLKGVKKKGARIVEMTTERGLTVRARVYIDATYEGDLMARARVAYTVGREGNDKYGETLNGVQVRDKHQFEAAVSPYMKEGDPSSGLLPGISPEPVARTGSGDRRIQAYNFRLCLTKNPDNRIPFQKPVGYDPKQYVLLSRYLAAGWNGVFGKFDPIRNGKIDKNNHGATSTDFIGMNYAYPEADYKTRDRIFREHVVYIMGWFWFLANDPSVPEHVRARMSAYGLCKDEFVETGGWPHQLYVREARRMVSDYVMTENNCRGKAVADDPVGLGAYNMDSHNCQRFVKDGQVCNEGDVQIGVKPYPISYRAIVPKKAECDNLLVPVCLSASHIAYGSIRMEPVFMILGQSAAIAADLAALRDAAVQDVPYAALREELVKEGQVVEWK